jgi:very-short-patch-repair endonuclease
MPERSHRSKQQTIRARDLRRDVSRTEHRLWPHLRGSATGAPFRRQHPVGPYFPDYYCVPLKLAVEVDGPTHAGIKDAERDAFLESLGVTMLRFSVQQIDENLDGVIDTIRDRVWFLQNQAH